MATSFMRAAKRTSHCRNRLFQYASRSRCCRISDFKAGLWDGSLVVPRLQVPLASKEKKLRIETQLTLNDSRLQSIINSFSEARKQPAVVPLDWKGAWRISGTAEIPMDQSEHFRWNGDAALDGDFVYASGQTNIALQKPTFSVRAEKQVVTISISRPASGRGASISRGCRSFCPRRRRRCDSKRSSHSTVCGRHQSGRVLARVKSSLVLLG